MQPRKTLLMISVATVLIVGCSKPQAETETVPASPPASDAAATTPVVAAPSDMALGEPAQASDAAAATFDISRIPVSDTPLPEWPYIALPAGYEFDSADDIAKHSKDLARVPVWTGGQLLWVEGRTFSDAIESVEGKSFSKFEVRKNLQRAVEALGGVRLSERSFDQAMYNANEKEIGDFREEFSKVRDAYWYDKDADTYLIRRADKAIWVVAKYSNNDAGLMVADSPLPEPIKK